jgi:hypothetical protein
MPFSCISVIYSGCLLVVDCGFRSKSFGSVDTASVFEKQIDHRVLPGRSLVADVAVQEGLVVKNG